MHCVNIKLNIFLFNFYVLKLDSHRDLTVTFSLKTPQPVRAGQEENKKEGTTSTATSFIALIYTYGILTKVFLIEVKINIET